MSLGSLRPVAAADDEGGIHLVWLTPAGFGKYDIYYASTATAVRAALNRVTWEDIGTSAAGSTWNTATALSFFPLMVIWLLLPFTWLVGFYLFRPDSDLTMRTGKLALVVAIALYLFSKLFMLPAFLWYATFMDIISPRFEPVVVLVVPLLIPVRPPEGTVPVEQLAGPDGRFADLDGVHVYYKVAGQGQPALLLLHGFAASLFCFFYKFVFCFFQK